ncbi:MAG: oligopeptide transporter, OPT family, partial [Gammaproteobacteria bacterium]|nr:oligopeptide transporter, OPT family [Gammaproteobacteria bacterium]
GTLMVGGLWTILHLAKPIANGMHQAVVGLRERRQTNTKLIRTEHDIAINHVFWIGVLLLIPLVFLLRHFINTADLGLSTHLSIELLAVLAMMTMLLGFVVTALCGYFAGLVGATNNPLSAMSISSILLVCVIILVLLAPEVHFHQNTPEMFRLGGMVILTLGVIACAGSISSDTMQDLKAGQMVGATPWKQQLMLFLGVVIAALVIPPILNLLLNAYGIGGVFPRPDMDHANMLTAPQAALMASIVTGVFGGGLSWGMIAIGAAIGVSSIIVDFLIKGKGYRIHALAVGLGIYLPITSSSCLVIGGLISYFVHRKLKQRAAVMQDPDTIQEGHQRATLLACGLVAGSTLMGVLLAGPFVWYKSSDALSIMPASWLPLAEILGLLSVIALAIWLFRVALQRQKSA